MRSYRWHHHSQLLKLVAFRPLSHDRGLCSCMNECCSVAGVFFLWVQQLLVGFFKSNLLSSKIRNHGNSHVFFVEKVPFFTTTYGMASKHRFWQRYVIIYIFLFCVDFLKFSSSPPFMGLGCMQSRTTNVGKKGVTTQTQWLHLGWYIDFRWGHFSQKSNCNNQKNPWILDFGPQMPWWSWHLFVSPVTGCDFTATPKNWGKDDRPRKQRRHQPGKVVLLYWLLAGPWQKNGRVWRV